MSTAAAIQFPPAFAAPSSLPQKPVRINSEGASYMPIRLKATLVRHDIGQPDWCAACIQKNGRPMSRAAGNQILNWQTWPALTDAKVIKNATEALLRQRGVPEAEIKTIWDEDPEDPSAFAHPPKATNQRKPAQPAEEPALEFHMEPEMLTQQAKQHFRLPRDPFRDDVNEPKDVFMTPDVRYVRETMYQAALHGDVVAVIAEVGAGKSTLRRELVDRFEREQKPVVIIQPKMIDKQHLKADHISDAIIQALDPAARVPMNGERKAAKAERMLAESMQAGNTHVILIEEGQDLSTRMLKMLKRFSELEKGMKKLLSIIIVGQSELDRKLDVRATPEAREFIHRCGKITLPPLDKHLAEYLAFKFKRVGVPVDEVFEADVADAIRDLLTLRDARSSRSMIYPLYVNNVCIKALNMAASLGMPKVSAAVIKELK